MTFQTRLLVILLTTIIAASMCPLVCQAVDDNSASPWYYNVVTETESNDTLASANYLDMYEGATNDGVQIVRSYISSSSDVDYFSFYAPRHGRLSIVPYFGSGLDYVCQVISSNGQILKTITNGVRDYIITLKPQSLEQYYIKVYSPSGMSSQSNSYGISLDYYFYGGDDEVWGIPVPLQHLYVTAPVGYDADIALLGYAYHAGTDFINSNVSPAYVDGTVPIYAMCSGTVVYATQNDSMGNYVVIKSDEVDPFTGNNYIFRYLHMEYSPEVSQGQIVSKGALLGYMGDTGDITGSHLHIDVNSSNIYDGGQLRSNPQTIINPIDFIDDELYAVSGDMY